MCPFPITQASRNPSYIFSFPLKIYEKALEYDYKVLGAEGKGGDGWLLVDVGFAIVNLFTVEDRARYDLDKVWGHYNEIDPITFEELK